MPVFWVDVDDKEARKILLADNRTSDLASYDDHALLDILRGIAIEDGNLIGTGFDTDDLDDLINDLSDGDPGDFPSFGDDIETNNTCPKCGYEF